MKLLLTSGGIRNNTMRSALVDMLGKPIAECNALCIPTGTYAFPGGMGGALRAWWFVTGDPVTTCPMIELGWKSVGVLELTALPSLPRENWVPMVQEIDVLLVNGGDTLYLAYWLQQSGLADLLPSLNAVYVGLSGGSLALCPRVWEDFIHWDSPTGSDKALGLVDFEMFPHLDHPDIPVHAMSYAEKWAETLSVPGYAIDDETAIQVIDGEVKVITEGHWRLFTV
jgi:dipeptidase E